eukprot:TRINITY_DN184_c0_g1_i14.p1 TRINITY_DN184_c0_g1~~TRINITY_DN184_c0_g1_i14.p1  ORF type:complete len:147 (+),score=38.21 TRINITY_DN184_c0_g1_i14:275-715(+)
MSAYVKLLRERPQAFEERVKEAYAVWKCCVLCGRGCGADRASGAQGFCKCPNEPLVASYGPHFGEESPLVGMHGSGTIFFSACNLLCVFCQNYDISHGREGERITVPQLAKMMLELQNAKGCHNINLVTPTHQLPVILDAVLHAAK